MTLQSRSYLTVLPILLILVAGRSTQAEVFKPLGPAALAFSPDGQTLCVVEADAARLDFVDVASRKISGSLKLPERPTGLAWGADQRLYVTCAAPRSRIVVVDSALRRQVGAISAGHTAVAPVFAANADRLFVCHRFEDEVAVVDLPANQIVDRVAVTRQPIAAVLTRDERCLVVANHLPLEPANGYIVRSVVSLIDTQTMIVTAVNLPDGAHSLRDICISPDDRYAVVTHILSTYNLVASHLDDGWMNTNAISVIDLRQRTCLGHAVLDDLADGAANPWGVRFSPDGKQLFVTHAGSHELSVIDAPALVDQLRQGRTLRGPLGRVNYLRPHRRRVPLPGNGPRSLAVLGNQVFIAGYFSDTVTKLDAKDITREPVTFRLGPEPQLSEVRLGEMLFHDARFCFERWQSCSSCHPDGRADGLNWDLMNDGTGNPKNTKSLLLVHKTPPAMVSGVRESAEAAVRSGIHHILFAPVDEDVARAIDEYLKSLSAEPSPRLVDGALGEAARRGQRLFEETRVGCARCHPAPLYTDLSLHALGPPDVDGRRQYDTPTLVEAWRTAPYYRDGRYLTVRQLLVDGRHGLTEAAARDLSDRDLDDLVEFVLSL